jgi:hypothetical protein
MNCQTLVKEKEHGFVAIVDGRICGYSTHKGEPIEFLYPLVRSMFKRYLEQQLATLTQLGFSARTVRNYLIIVIMDS